jgi:uncharacterized protein (DUF427 family)
MKAVWNGAVIAESDETITVDGNHYFPPNAVNSTLLRDSHHTTVCGWKGTARYYSIEVDGETNPNAAWYYPHPKPAADEITGRVAFWKGVELVD